jgi:hypothetical protein
MEKNVPNHQPAGDDSSISHSFHVPNITLPSLLGPPPKLVKGWQKKWRINGDKTYGLIHEMT